MPTEELPKSEEKKAQDTQAQEKPRPQKPVLVHQAAGKWKGKDWFAISAPKMFNNAVLAETPAIDSSSIMGRRLEVNVSQLTSQASKYYMSIGFKINKVEGKNASTVFDGYSCTRDYLFHVVRKRTDKVRHLRYVETKDGWKLQVTALLILNRKTNTNVKNKMRAVIDERLDSAAKNNGIDSFIKDVIAGSIQKEMKRVGNKTYPVRFSEIEKIEVIKAPLEK